MSLLDAHPLWKGYVTERGQAQERLQVFRADERERWAKVVTEPAGSWQRWG